MTLPALETLLYSVEDGIATITLHFDASNLAGRIEAGLGRDDDSREGVLALVARGARLAGATRAGAGEVAVVAVLLRQGVSGRRSVGGRRVGSGNDGRSGLARGHELAFLTADNPPPSPACGLRGRWMLRVRTH